MPEDDNPTDSIAFGPLARWLRLLRLLFTVILLGIGVWHAFGGL